MAGYVRNDTSNNIATGNVINAADLDGEFDAIQAAFVNTTGHTHDGTAAEGAPITKIGPTQDVIASSTTLTPKTTNAIDVGSSSLKFKDAYFAGTVNSATLTLTNALSVANGGTGVTTIPALSVFVANTLNTITTVTPTSGQSIRVNAGGTAWEAYTPSVPDVTAAGNNAFTGANTFYNATGQTFGTATSTQDGIIIAGRAGGSSAYRVTLQPTTLTASRTLTLPDATSTVAVLGLAQTFTAQQTLSGSTSVLAAALTNAAETATVSATAATGTINYDITTQSVLYYTSNASANWTVNFRASSGTSLNTALATGQSVTVAFLVTQGSTAYYNNVVQVDGTTSGVTTRWIGGAPTAGNASGIDSYRYVIIKTANTTFTVLASVNQFKA